MKIAIEKGNNIKLFKIDGRNLNKFLEKVRKINGNLSAVWTYSHIEKLPNSTIGLYKNIIHI